MFSHIVLGAEDVDASKAFYDATLGVIGVAPGNPTPDGGRVVYMSPSGGLLIIGKPINGEPASCANGGTIGFSMTSGDQVDAWHAAGVAHGGTPCEDPPGIRQGPFGPLYLAYMRDPAGNKLCGVYRAG
ncbi:VOC family protein [Sphingobium algorifonticola]|uniref:VOC family protein n=1 Tax=Sphingobium algorifonticola TaxID=2008318 RepID=A0A437JCG8_9SPHN|nr:VOC family protein [Sphingobium algorifonticola]RVT43440.1 VOC family protein [Sphingobium algorifonticola]